MQLVLDRPAELIHGAKTFAPGITVNSVASE